MENGTPQGGGRKGICVVLKPLPKSMPLQDATASGAEAEPPPLEQIQTPNLHTTEQTAFGKVSKCIIKMTA